MNYLMKLARARAASRAPTSYSEAGVPPTTNGGTTAPSTPGPKPPSAPSAPKQEPNKGFNPWQVLKGIDTTKPLGPKEMREAARALTALEIRPQLHGYKQLANQLTHQKQVEAQGLAKLGTNLEAGVGDVYRNIAQSEAENMARQNSLGQMLTQQSGNIASQAAATENQMQNTQTQGVEGALALRGAPGGGVAQDELAKAVAAQKAAQAANSAADQQFAGSQAAGYTHLTGAQGNAALLQGAGAESSIAHQIVNRTAANNLKLNQGIQEALGKLADTKALKGSTFAKNLMELREKEQKFKLGEQAVHGERQGQKLKEKENEQAQEQKQKENAQWAKEFGLKNWEAHHPEASSGEAQKKAKELHQEVAEIKSLIPTAVAAAKGSKEAKSFEAYVSYINGKASASPQLVRKVLKHWWGKKTAKEETEAVGQTGGF